MAKQKTRLEQFNERVDALKDEHIEYLDGVSGIKRKLMESVLHDWCVVCAKLEDVIEDVIETGTTITLKNGNPAKNPDVSTMHQLINEKNSMLPKMLKHLGDEAEEPADEFAAFMRGR